MRSTRKLALLVGIALLAAAPMLGAGQVTNGIDTWITTTDGSSFIDFAAEPIPADFFCLGSEPFTGRIAWQGKPLASVPEGALGQADTVVQRLDNAVFNQDGVATTRLQVRALSLRSLEPIHTACGSFNVAAALHGLQPMTSLEIRQGSGDSGTFSGSLAMNVRLTFTPARVIKGRSWIPVPHTKLTLDHLVELMTPETTWRSTPPKANLPGQIGGFVLLDTDDDGVADTYVPGQSAFYPQGSSRSTEKAVLADGCGIRPIGTTCHPSGQYENGVEKCHCVGLSAE